MNRLFPLPLYTFLKIIFQNGGLAIGGLWKIPGWMLKTIVLEPLRWLELILFRNKVRRHTITKAPIFILGFYRSGTSYLHEFFTQDDRLGYHTNFQMVFPEIMLSSEWWLSPVLERISRLFHLHDPVHRIPLSFRFPGEEDGTMCTAVNPRGAQWGFFFPKKMKDYFRKYVLFEDLPIAEKEAWTGDFLYLLKKISLANKGKRLVLKSPPNTARIGLLLSLFPDARFIFIHRNPFDVYASNQRFWKVTRRIYALGGSGGVDTNADILDTYAGTMQRYLQEKDLVPPGHLMEMAYEDFVQNPLSCIRDAYTKLHLDDFRDCEKRMISFAARQKSFKVLNHALAPGERKRVADKLGYVISRWNYPAEKT